MTPQQTARQALKAALNGTSYGKFEEGIYGQSMRGGVFLTKEAARLIDQMLTRAHYEGELEKAEREGE